ncbi:MAG: peptidyl-prolyl cis-trans isomerase [Holosporaceae bacterium]|jgi:peptidyl-prolyl cis-trans isomerase C|nr:peptidyl-prolyl cis-trans isomerase [Holosporaceae bacterium]
MRINLICIAAVLSFLYADYTFAGAVFRGFSKKNSENASESAKNTTEGADKASSNAEAGGKAEGNVEAEGKADAAPAPAAEESKNEKVASDEVSAAEMPKKEKAIVGDPVVLKIGRKEFRRSQVLDDMKGLPPQLVKGVNQDRLFAMVRDQRMSTYLMIEQAKKAGMDKTKEFLEKLDQMKEDLMARVFLMKEILPKAENESALKARYAKYVMEFKKTKEHHLYHIMVASEDEAKAVLAELGEGKDFSDVAKRKSVAPSKEKGGDEGFIPLQILPSPMKDTLQALKEGEYTKEAIKTEAGLHIFRVAENRDSVAQKYEDCKDALKQMVVQEEVMKLIERLEKQYNVEKFNEDGSPYVATEPPATN